MKTNIIFFCLHLNLLASIDEMLKRFHYHKFGQRAGARVNLEIDLKVSDYSVE